MIDGRFEKKTRRRGWKDFWLWRKRPLRGDASKLFAKISEEGFGGICAVDGGVGGMCGLRGSFSVVAVLGNISACNSTRRVSFSVLFYEVFAVVFW
jgi:hypothetical protein